MPVRKKTSTTRLPQALQQQLAEASSTTNTTSGADHHPQQRYGQNYARRAGSRKESRKQEREAQKQRKAQYFSQVTSTTRKRAQDERDHRDEPQRKRSRLGEDAPPPPATGSVQRKPVPASSTPTHAASSAKSASKSTSKSTAKPAPSTSSSTKNTPPKTKPQTSALEKLASKSKSKSTSKSTRTKTSITAPTLRTTQDDKEDAYIAYLEAQLGLGRGGKNNKKKGGKEKKVKGDEDEDDGLDDLLDWADSFSASKYSARVPEESADEDEDWVGFDGSEEEDNDDAGDEEDASETSSSSEYDEESDEEDEDAEEEWQGIGASANSDSGSEGDVAEEPTLSAAPAPQAAKGAYIPPHLRNIQTDAANSEALMKLKRQLKGLLNRMTEQNIASIIDAVEEVYREHRRNDVSSTLTSLIIEGISSHSSLLDSYVVLHAAFVSALHKVIGIEFAAHFLQTVVASYEKHFTALQTATTEGDSASEGKDSKECSNLLVLLSELYNFQVISCVLVFDLVRALLDGELTEFKVELLLKLARNSGQQLRVDDPSALKDIIEIVQTKTTNSDALSSRTRFMIETLTNLKNNKLKRNVTQNQGGASVERMKKFLAGLTKTKHVLAHDALRVSLDDLHSADTRGKWWLVGAAWGGNPLVDKKDEFAAAKSGATGTGAAASAKKEKDLAVNESADLINLARLQGMNTDIRRGIFVVLMSSEDYVDACERLSQLDLNEVQQREIIRVILHCCGNERTYNPYYTLVGQQLCRLSHSYKITLQFSLWDFLRDMGEKGVGGAAVVKNADDVDDFDVKSISESRIQNVANAYAWWIAKDCLTLLVLKPVDFTILKPQTKQFLKALFSQIFVNSQRSTPRVGTAPDANAEYTRNRNAVEEIFTKAARLQTLAMGIVYFLSEEFKPKKESSLGGTDEYAKFIRWAVGVAKDTLRTGVDIASVL